MADFLSTLSMYFSFPFVRYAIIVGILIALSSSLLGVVLVLKRFSFIGDGLSHVAFGAMAVSAVVGLTDNMYLTLIITVLTSILLLCTNGHAKIKGDASLAMISVGALAIGYLILNIFNSKNANLSGDVCTVLFGSTSILTLTKTEVWLSIALALVVLCYFVFFYNKIFAITFDESFAKSSGAKVDVYNFVMAVIVGLVIVLAMNLVGSLLISALVIFPALSSMRVFKNFKAVTICSLCISVITAFFGIVASIIAGTPVGSTIVFVDILIFAIFYIIGLVLGKVKR